MLPSEISCCISELMYELRLPVYFTGYHYLKSAIIDAVLCPDRIPDISSQLLKNVADEFHTDKRHVERAVSKAVSHINSECGTRYITNKILGYETDAYGSAISVKELIALIADQLRIRYQS